MANGLLKLSDQFQGLPMGELIGGPLSAAADTQVQLAQSTADFINQVGFETETDETQTPPVTVRKMRYVEFTFERPKQIEDTTTTPPESKVIAETVKLTVPMLSIVPVPNLQIDNVDVTFDMEVKSSTSSKSSTDFELGWDVELKVHYGPVSLKVNVEGKVSTHKENTRTSDNSAKYTVGVHATNHGMPEGLMRVWDIMAASIAPVTKEDPAKLLTA